MEAATTLHLYKQKDSVDVCVPVYSRCDLFSLVKPCSQSTCHSPFPQRISAGNKPRRFYTEIQPLSSNEYTTKFKKYPRKVHKRV